MVLSPDSYTDDEVETDPGGQTRRYLLTGFLGFLVVAFSFVVSINVAALSKEASRRELLKQYPDLPEWFVPAVTVCDALLVFWTLAILRGRRIGFFGFLLTSLVVCGLHVSVHRYIEAGLSLVWIVILLILLRWGGPRSAWSQLI